MAPEGEKSARQVAAEDNQLARHRELVASGDFDRIPISQPTVRDMVAVRMNDLVHEVYELRDDSVVVGYDFKRESVRRTIPYADIRGAADYQTVLLKYSGFQPGRYRVEVDGREARLIDEADKNADLN